MQVNYCIFSEADLGGVLLYVLQQAAMLDLAVKARAELCWTRGMAD